MIFDNWSAINQISSFNKWEIQEIPAPLLEFKSFYLDNHLKSLQMMTCKILFFSPRTEPKQDPLRPSRTNPRSHWEHLILVKCPLFSPIYIKLQTTNCAVILRYCKSKLDKKCRSYLTLKHSMFLILQFPQFFKGLERGLLTKIRCSRSQCNGFRGRS